MAMSSDGGVELPGGAVVQWTAWGPPDGTPVVFFHGCPGSRLQGFGTATAEQLGVRVVALDRPGIGGSSPWPGWTLTGWAPTVAAVLDRLGFDEVALCGHGAGGAAALAVGRALPGRVRRIAVVSGGDCPSDPEVLAGLEPHDQAMIRLVAEQPEQAEAALAHLARGIAADPTVAVQLVTSHWSELDRQIGTRLDLGDILTTAYAEAVRNPDGFARDSIVAISPWGFDAAEVTVRTTVWAGEHDVWRFHAPDRGRSLPERLPNGELVSCPNDGATLLWNRATEILSWLAR
jgi:pimeloyl-ACP methyl ester carboxylesterase